MTPSAAVPSIRASLAAGKPLVGTWCGLGDSVSLEIVARAGFDWICIDLQHGVAADAALPGLLQAADAAGVPALVRPRWNEAAAIGHALDLGAAGVVVPLVDGPVEAARAVASCRYPPSGDRSWGPTRMDTGTDSDAVCVVMVESAAAVDAIDDIVVVPGLDGVFVGPTDLSLSLNGRTGGDVKEAVERVSAACARVGLVAGTACGRPSDIAAATAAGFRLLTVDWDIGMLRASASATVEAARAAVAATGEPTTR